MNSLAVAYNAAGKVDQGLQLSEETLKLMKAKLGADHPDTLASMNNLAAGYLAGGRLDQALLLLEETLKLRRAKLGDDHPDTLTTMNSLAFGYRAAGKLDQALPLWEQTLKLRRAKLGADHPHTLTSMNNLAASYLAGGRLDQALPLLEEALKLRRAKLGADHPDTLTTANNLAAAYQAAGKLDQAVPLWEQTLKLMKAKLGADHPDTLTTMNNLAAGYQSTGRLDQALPLYEQAAISVEKSRFQHEHAGPIVSNFIRSLEATKDLAKAETWRRKWLAVVKQRSGAESLAYAEQLAALGTNLLQQQKWTDAEAVLRECLAIREKTQPEEWTTFNTMSLLGGALLGRAGSVSDESEKAKLLAEAEPLLVKGYEGMKQREKTPATDAERLTLQQCLAEALDRLIKLYTATNKPGEVKRYQELRAKYAAAKDVKK